MSIGTTWLQPLVWALQLALVWLVSQPLVAQAETSSSKTLGLSIEIAGDGWGNIDRDELETLLYAVADELVTKPTREHIIVTHSEGSPVTLFRRGPRGEFFVRLSAQDRRWSQFAYQFGHELCHILSNFATPDATAQGKRNQWFEEALCETAALYTLRSLARTWEKSAPHANWEDYAPTLRAYADRMLGEQHRNLPAHTTLATWLGENLGQLEGDAYLRYRNEVVATALLPIFEKNRNNWGALSYLNLDPDDATSGLTSYLQHWHRQAPHEFKEVIGEVAGHLGLDLSAGGGHETVAQSAVARTAGETQAGPAGLVQ